MTLVLKALDLTTEPAWDRFVHAMPQASFFHLAGWRRVIEQAFGHRTLYTVAERDGAIVGILPLAQVKTALFGNTLISVPFCVYGGPVGVDHETTRALEDYATGLMRQTGASAVEFRYQNEVTSEWVGRPDLYVTFSKPIEADADRNMKAIPRKQRAMVRKGIQNELVSIAGQDTDALHRVYAESVRNLGTPVFSRHYFRILANEFSDCMDVVTILDQDTPVASVMNFYFRDAVLPYYGGGTARARGRAANDFMYWEVMRRAAERGARSFDFGRSKIGTGAFAFKHNWGFEALPLHYRYALKPGGAIPELNPNNPKYRLFIAAWRKLPITVANVIGPHIVRGIG